eukprot:scaffold12045_cov83-Skeletonema_marinoi.AAC.1
MMLLRYFIPYYVLKVYDRVARHEKYTYFQGRDGGYNFSAVVKDMTLIRSNNVTDGIYVRFQ